MHRWEYNIKMDLTETTGDVDWINEAQNTD